MIAVTHMERTYFDAKEQTEKDAGIGNIYCRLSLRCIKKKVRNFEAKELTLKHVLPQLTLQHKRRLQAAMKYSYSFV